MTRLAALLLLVGCGATPPPFAPTRTCAASGFTVNLQADTLPQCSYYRALVAASLSADAVFISDSELGALRAEPVYVFANSFIPDGICRGTSGAISGCNTGDMVFLSASGSAIAHEWLHQHARITTGDPESDHADWNTKGAPPGAPVGWDNVYYGPVLVGSWLDVANAQFQESWEATYDVSLSWMCAPGAWHAPDFDVSTCYLEP